MDGQSYTPTPPSQHSLNMKIHHPAGNGAEFVLLEALSIAEKLHVDDSSPRAMKKSWDSATSFG